MPIITLVSDWQNYSKPSPHRKQKKERFIQKQGTGIDMDSDFIQVTQTVPVTSECAIACKNAVTSP